jgi:flagellar hook-basal body complex protein FliE
MNEPVSFDVQVGAAGLRTTEMRARPQEASPSKSFRDVLMGSLEEVNRLQSDADQSVQRLLTGETDNVTEVFAAVNKAGIAFDLLMEVRNKLTEAYQEIQQMRI